MLKSLAFRLLGGSTYRWYGTYGVTRNCVERWCLAPQASTSVRHVVLPCHWSQRESVAADCVRTYGSHGRTIVFTDTKRDANELATGLESFGARPLHGDIPQSTREVRIRKHIAGTVWSFRVLLCVPSTTRP